MKRTCAECGVDISGRGNRAKRCVPCAKDRQREQCCEWRKANPKKMREYNREYYEANLERIQDRSRRYREANPQKWWKYREAVRKWQKNNSEKTRGYLDKWRKNNSEKVKENNRKYHKANPEKAREGAHRRRALELAQLGLITKNIASKLLKDQGGCCAAPGCGKSITLRGHAGAHLDHIIPHHTASTWWAP